MMFIRPALLAATLILAAPAMAQVVDVPAGEVIALTPEQKEEALNRAAGGATKIEPAVGDIATMDFSRAAVAVQAGYAAAMATIQRL